MDAKTDSEVTSLAPSSPTKSPPRRGPVYYVQSPSRDSHDGEKNSMSFQSTPVISPTGSPPQSHSSVGRHSRESSSTRFSGSLKPGSQKISPNDAVRGGHSHNHSHSHSHRKGQKPLKDCAVIEEEGLDVEEREKGIPCRCYFPLFVLGFFLFFAIFSFILWGASKPMKPKINLKSITFEQFIVQAGSDFTGVATDMISINSTLKLTYRNTGTFFGVHVNSRTLDLSLSEMTVASGAITRTYFSRQSQKTLSIAIMGDKIPMYGSGVSLNSLNGTMTQPVPLGLNLVVRSKANVLGNLVKTKFTRRIKCSFTYDPKKHTKAILLKNSCSYD